MTHTIVAFDGRSGALGVASGASTDIRAHSLVMGTPSGGLIVSQGATPGQLAPGEMTLLAAGTDARDLLAAILARDDERGQRQILIVDARGRTAAHSGRGCRRFFAHTEGTDHVAAGDNLPSPNVVGAMSLSFERSGGDPLWDRLLLALESGARAGGDHEGTRAAMLVVYTNALEPAIDLVVEDSDDPVRELRRLLSLSS